MWFLGSAEIPFIDWFFVACTFGGQSNVDGKAEFFMGNGSLRKIPCQNPSFWWGRGREQFCDLWGVFFWGQKNYVKNPIPIRQLWKKNGEDLVGIPPFLHFRVFVDCKKTHLFRLVFSSSQIEVSFRGMSRWDPTILGDPSYIFGSIMFFCFSKNRTYTTKNSKVPLRPHDVCPKTPFRFFSWFFVGWLGSPFKGSSITGSRNSIRTLDMELILLVHFVDANFTESSMNGICLFPLLVWMKLKVMTDHIKEPADFCLLWFFWV